MAGAVAFSYSTEGGFLHKISPTVKLFAIIVFSILSMRLTLFYSLLLTLFLLILSYSAHIRLIREWRRAKLICFFSLLIIFTTYLSKKDWALSINEGIRLMNILSLAMLFTSSSDTNETASEIGYLLSKIIGGRGREFASLLMLTFALLPLIAETGSEMLNARRARNGSFIHHPLKFLSEYLTSFLLLLISKADSFEDALEARSFKKDAERASRALTPSDKIIVLCLVIILIAIIVLL